MKKVRENRKRVGRRRKRRITVPEESSVQIGYAPATD